MTPKIAGSPWATCSPMSWATPGCRRQSFSLLPWLVSIMSRGASPASRSAWATFWTLDAP